jgi:uncharacterized protein (TIGR02271 family)
MPSERRGDIDWNNTIKKEAKGLNDEKLGEVQEIGINFILVQKGSTSKDKFYIPYSQVESYDGEVLRFNLSEEEIKSNYSRDPSASLLSPNISIVKGDTKMKEMESKSTTILPVVEEKLNISKVEAIYREAKIIKEPVTQIEEIEVSLTHEELIMERRPAGENAPSIQNLEPPVISRQEIKIPLKREEVELKKKIYVKEEVVVKKKRVVETKTITEEVKSERLLDSSQDISEGK